MKRPPLCLFRISMLLATAVGAQAQSTAFTYQGRLNDGTASANGIYDLRFEVYEGASAGNEASGVLTNAATVVSNGLFAVTLDFGAGVFTGPERWLEIGVRTNGGASFTPLLPRQPITGTPYAVFSASSGSVSNGLIQNPLFLGTTGNTPLELFAGGERALRLEPNTSGAANVIGGSLANRTAPGVVGATIGGGGAVNYFGASYTNQVRASFGTIGGGADNLIGDESYTAVIAGGYLNSIQYAGYQSAIAGGYQNTISSNSWHGFIGGGSGNVIANDAYAASIVGGYQNTNASLWSVIGGGNNNRLEANSFASMIGSGWQNVIYTNAGLSFIGGGQENVIESQAGQSVIGGGWLNRIHRGADQSVVAGGNAGNIFNGSREAFIGSGFANRIMTNSSGSAIVGGFGNTVHDNSGASVIGGGQDNSVSNASAHATIGGGYRNVAASPNATVGGGHENFASGNINAANGDSATVAGGYQNAALGNNAVIGGGFANYARGDNSTIGGGWLHTNMTGFGVIGGGQQHLLEPFARFSVIAGGDNNTIHSNSTHAVIAGGQFNSIGTNAIYATIPGGVSNLAAGPYSFAAGRRAKAMHRGAFVWADSQDPNFVSSSSNQFLIRASGGVGIGVTNPAAALHVAGTVKAAAFEGSGAPLTFTTTNNQPLEFKANSMRILRLEYAGDSETDPDTAPDGAPNVIAGAPNNVVQPGVVGATIAGGGATNLFGLLYPNTVNSDFAAIGGGAGNTIRSNSAASVIAGGFVNRILGTNTTDAASIGGGLGNAVHSGARHATIAGGTFNHIGTDAADATIGGGSDNFAAAPWTVIGGGNLNTNSAEASTIGGGTRNVIGIDATHSVIAGGEGNSATLAQFASILGGRSNLVEGLHGSVAGGLANRATGQGATVPGGVQNTASGSYSFAAGLQATAGHAGSFVWADSQGTPFGSMIENQFLIRAEFVGINRATRIGSEVFGIRAPVTNAYGGMYMETLGTGLPFYGYAMAGSGYAWTYLDGSDGNKWKLYNGGVWLTVTTSGNVGIANMAPSERLHVNGNILASGTITPNSDRSAKTDITAADPQAILERVAELPIHEWRFKTEAEGVKHVGPMAQDFRAAFGLGAHETAIATVDADGVALAAIKGLNQKLEERLKEKEAKITALEERLARLENVLTSTTRWP